MNMHDSTGRLIVEGDFIDANINSGLVILKGGILVVDTGHNEDEFNSLSYTIKCSHITTIIREGDYINISHRSKYNPPNHLPESGVVTREDGVYLCGGYTLLECCQVFAVNVKNKEPLIPLSVKPKRRKVDHDPVNNPKHYDLFADGTQSMDILQAALTQEEFIGFLKGNCLKYRLRAGNKDNLQQDIDKANWYKNKIAEVLNVE